MDMAATPLKAAHAVVTAGRRHQSPEVVDSKEEPAVGVLDVFAAALTQR